MREILFRGKTKSGEWVYGFYGHKPNGNEVEEHFIMEWCFNGASNRVDTYFQDVPVIPETVGQYTGLKDKNGEDIFEGDIHEYDGRHFDVKFGYYTDDDTHIEMYGWYLDSNSLEEQGSLGVDSEKYVNIIGNIHDDQELLNDSL